MFGSDQQVPEQNEGGGRGYEGRRNRAHWPADVSAFLGFWLEKGN